MTDPLRIALLALFIPFVFSTVGCNQPAPQQKSTAPPDSLKEAETMPAIRLTSPAFEAGGPIPRKYTGEGVDVSPPLAWEGVPTRAKELALICDDPDAPRADPWVHWVLYRIPTDSRGLAEGSNGGAMEGRTDSGHGYGGPMPPRGHGVHHYHFRIYALDQPLSLGANATKKDLLASMQGHVLAEGELVGTYERK